MSNGNLKSKDRYVSLLSGLRNTLKQPAHHMTFSHLLTLFISILRNLDADRAHTRFMIQHFLQLVILNMLSILIYLFRKIIILGILSNSTCQQKGLSLFLVISKKTSFICYIDLDIVTMTLDS